MAMRWRPLARRRFRTAWPFLVAMRARKPWVRLRLVLLGLRRPFFISFLGTLYWRTGVTGQCLGRAGPQVMCGRQTEATRWVSDVVLAGPSGEPRGQLASHRTTNRLCEQALACYRSPNLPPLAAGAGPWGRTVYTRSCTTAVPDPTCQNLSPPKRPLVLQSRDSYRCLRPNTQRCGSQARRSTRFVPNVRGGRPATPACGRRNSATNRVAVGDCGGKCPVRTTPVRFHRVTDKTTQ
jgi:hypothetical protein